jgi:hypothetical protein
MGSLPTVRLRRVGLLLIKLPEQVSDSVGEFLA